MSFLPSVVPGIRSYLMKLPIITNNPKLSSFIDHPAGPLTIHFWAPTFKWCITLANLADLGRSPEHVSTAQQIAVTATGLIWSRYSLVITPVNYNLLSVNIFMAASGLIQLYRKFTFTPVSTITNTPTHTNTNTNTNTSNSNSNSNSNSGSGSGSN